MNYTLIKFPGYPKSTKGCMYKDEKQLHKEIVEVVLEVFTSCALNRIPTGQYEVNKGHVWMIDGEIDMILYNVTIHYNLLESTEDKTVDFNLYVYPLTEMEYVDKWLLQ